LTSDRFAIIAPMRRDPEHGLVAGVCAGLARALGVDALVVRVAFLVATLASGLGLALYVLGWAFLPAGPGTVAPAARLRTGRGSIEVALGVGLLVLSALLAFRALGVWPSDAIVWPVTLIAGGGALLWRASATAPPRPAEPAAPEPPPQERAKVAGRTGLGVALVLAAALVFLEATGALAAARDVLLAALAVAVVVAVIGAPWIARLARSLAAERAERIRSQERAEVAAHLHDSVLQTLALVQQRADDPRAVATLARRQERELRSWLSGRTAAGGHLAAALEAAADEVEQMHGVPIDVVAVGDAPLDAGGEAVVAAAREAMVNAAKFAGAAPVAVYAEAGDGRLHVFVRDRGPGFDPGAVPDDRRGVRESIVGRMARHGGRAEIHAAPGAGTEVELVLEP
jgi:signal transduction histidine kinase/phage shock protein PspC (stress-responsive transcriptional regulator)